MDRDEDRASPTAAAQALPAAEAPILGAQFVAIAWVVLNQFRGHLGLEAGAKSGLVAKGYLGAALFFVLSGYLSGLAYLKPALATILIYVGTKMIIVDFYKIHSLVSLAVIVAILAIAVIASFVKHRLEDRKLPPAAGVAD